MEPNGANNMEPVKSMRSMNSIPKFANFAGSSGCPLALPFRCCPA